MTATDPHIPQTPPPPAGKPSLPDQRLLRLYATEGDAEAFACLVRRYQGLVYASAVRRLRGDRHLAEDVSQAVFMLLAERAGRLAAKPGLPLAGWLHRAAGYAAANAARVKHRRQKHERAVMQATPTREQSSEPSASGSTPARFGPWLDAAIDRLGDADRAAVLARFAQGLSIEQTAAAIGVSVEAAKKRVQRALDRLRGVLSKHDSGVTALAVAAALQDDARASAAGEAFAARVVESIRNPGGSPAAAAIAKGAWNMMWWKQVRRIAAVSFASVLLLGGAGAALSQLDLPASPVATRADAADAFAWSEPREITVNDDSQRDDDCIDLDTGKTGTPGRPFRDRADGRAWFTDSGMDAHSETSDEPGENGLYGMGVAWILVPDEAFDNLSPGEVDRRLAGVDVEWDHRADADGGLPVTYLFKTKDGGQGVIQFTRIERGPEKPLLAMRWKQIRRGGD